MKINGFEIYEEKKIMFLNNVDEKIIYKKK